MKLHGTINRVPVVAMIDSGATHCFISPRTVSALQLPVDSSTTLPVRLGDGKDTNTTGVCQSVSITLGSACWEKS